MTSADSDARLAAQIVNLDALSGVDVLSSELVLHLPHVQNHKIDGASGTVRTQDGLHRTVICVNSCV
jgi:hypothetical protein